MLVLEDLEHARRRGARAYAEVRGYGMSGDACHVTQPHVRGLGASLAMQRALANGVGEAARRCLAHINAHATSTPMGDDVEALAIARVFAEAAGDEGAVAACGVGEPDEDAGEYLAALRGQIGGVGAGAGAAAAAAPLSGLPPLDRVAVSSTKGATGHLLGAAGAVEAAFTALAVAGRVAPPTANLDAPDPLVAERLPLLVGGPAAATAAGGASPSSATGGLVGGLVRGPYALGGGDYDGGGGPVSALCNSFGFGGTNASVLFATPPEDVRRGG